VASVQGDKYYLADGPAAFEDGTLDYLNIPAIEIGLKHFESIGYEVIHERVRMLTGWLLENLAAMRHSTGPPPCQHLRPHRRRGTGRLGHSQLLR
jgi:molybdenum cofactor sulfurtransferase